MPEPQARIEFAWPFLYIICGNGARSKACETQLEAYAELDRLREEGYLTDEDGASLEVAIDRSAAPYDEAEEDELSESLLSLGDLDEFAAQEDPFVDEMLAFINTPIRSSFLN